MPKPGRSNGTSSRAGQTAKYDAHHNVLDKAYGAFADLRRQLADSKTAVAERTELLHIFSNCADSQRAFLLLEDYFEKLALARKDFPGTTWWPRMLAVTGKARLEEAALLFLKNNRSLPTELAPHANLTRFAEIEAAEQEEKFIQQLEQWLLPPRPVHLDAPRASLRVLCTAEVVAEGSSLYQLKMEFFVFRPRAGEKKRTLPELLDLRTRAAHEQELFPGSDWECIQWLTDLYAKSDETGDCIRLTGTALLEWLSRWGDTGRLELSSPPGVLIFRGQMAELAPDLASDGDDLAFTHYLKLADGSKVPLSDVKFFAATPRLALIGNTAFLVRNGPPDELLQAWLPKPFLAVRKLSHRLLTHLRRSHGKNGTDWEQLCQIHTARPQFVFELSEETVRLRLLASSEVDESNRASGSAMPMRFSSIPSPMPGTTNRGKRNTSATRLSSACSSALESSSPS